MELLAEVKLNDLLVYADTLDYNHSLRDEPPFQGTRYVASLPEL